MAVFNEYVALRNVMLDGDRVLTRGKKYDGFPRKDGVLIATSPYWLLVSPDDLVLGYRRKEPDDAN